MTNLINTTRINTVNYLTDYTKGKFRFIVKCRAGFMTVTDARDDDNERYIQDPESLLTGFTKGAIQTIEFCPEGGNYYLTIFAKKGTTVVLMDKAIMANLTVGTINQLFYNTNLYSQDQYNAVNARTWADKAYVDNVLMSS